MKTAPTLMLALLCSTTAAAAPTNVTCNGRGLDPVSGRQALAGVVTLDFEFDQRQQTMALIGGAPRRVELFEVSITDAIARGTDGKWIYTVNRIEGTASMRADLARDADSARLGLGGDYFRGTCAKAGTAKF